jgi:acetamidase/formamidase/AraC-like DNA-binding protein
MAIDRFDTDPYPLERRAGLWSEALQPAGLVFADGVPPPNGKSWSHPGQHGARFTLIAGKSGLFHRSRPAQAGHLLLTAMLDGAALLPSGTRFGAGEVICCTHEAGPLLELAGAARLMVLTFSRSDPRSAGLGSTMTPAPTRLQLAAPSVFLFLLNTIAEALASGADSMLAPLDHALSDTLPAMVAQSQRGGNGYATVRQRVMQALERQLAESHLNLARFAVEAGISERAIQKIFEAEGYSFSQYLRNRRLARAAEDLRDPGLTSLPVADIGLRYGFDDPAHFSRSFRQSYGMTPASYRLQGGGQRLQGTPAPRSRGRPQAAGRPEAAPLPEPEEAQAPRPQGPVHHHLRATPKTIHWGYFSRALPPVLTVNSGDTVTVETITQHASDDAARMIAGDEDAEAIFRWTPTHKAVDRRGAGPLDASIYGRGAGEGFGVHILTGPIAIEGAQPHDILEVEIIDITPRQSQAPGFEGRSFGSNASVWWGYHYDDQLTAPAPREIVTIYEVMKCGNHLCAHAAYSFKWAPQKDPFGVVHPTIDYPGVPVDHMTISKREKVLHGVHVPVRPHFGTIGVAPNYPGPLDSVPPSAFGGNIDNWRLGPGTRIFLPVSVPGALLSLGDPHAAQGDGELCGTAIECSMTGHLRLTLHKRAQASPMLKDLNYPLIETDDLWVIQGFSHADYLADFGPAAQSEVYKRSSLDSAMRDAFRKARRFLMTAFNLGEDEAISLLSVAVDFGITQVVDGNLGVHACIPKSLFGKN